MTFERGKDGHGGILGVLLLLLVALWSGAGCASGASRQQAVDEWRNLTSPTSAPPRVFVKGDEVQLYFQEATNVVEFGAHWSKLRVPTESYRINSALLRWHQKLSRVPGGKKGWREAVVIAGAEWNRMMTNLMAVLTPPTPMHGIYYQGFMSDRLLYRDPNGQPMAVAIGDQPAAVAIDRRYSMDETFDLMAQRFDEDLARRHPGNSLFLLMAPNTNRFIQPLLLDRKQRQCVWMSPAALYDPSDRGVGLSATAQGLEALFVEGHVVAVVKNPVSTIARLGDLGIQTVLRILQAPIPKPGNSYAQVTHAKTMDLDQWEKWLDHYTGTRREPGSIDLLLDGERFFPRLQQAIAEATNHIHFEVYIFDKDDVAISVADQLKRRSSDIEVKVILDRVGSIAASMSPPATPLPDDFTPPPSIISYLKEDSKVRVHPFLNPWMSSDHSKVFLVDGNYAWLGGMNLGREYRYEWHDVMVELRGPIVASLEDQFRRDWAHAGTFGDFGYAAQLLAGRTKPKTEGGPWIPLRLLPTKTGWKPFSAAVKGAISKSQNYIFIENPYLYDKGVIAEMVRARNRGVDVRVILPRVNDIKAGGRSNLVTANYLLQHGIRVFFYPGMTHAKALLVDDWVVLGSGNLNHLSLGLCQEQNVATSDPAFSARVKKELFEEDFSRCYEMSEPIAVDWVDFLTDQILVDF
jgi:phosphatidylserine/phosphatidylglycerophosphate/cardiolipin synthase-like enzyme